MEDYEYGPSCGVCGTELARDPETDEEYCPEDPDHTFYVEDYYEVSGMLL